MRAAPAARWPFAFTLAALVAASLGCAHRGAPLAPARVPRLFVMLTVDQMAAPYVGTYGAQFTGGFARLLREGAVFTEAYQDHAVTETAPGHSVVLSGRYPYSTGIIRNSEGVGDTTAPLIDGRGPGASPRRFRGTEFLDWLRARWPGARMLSVSRKDRGAILPVGRARDGVGVYWFDSGIFTTSRWYADTLPAWLRAFDATLPPLERPTPYYAMPQLDSLEIACALAALRTDSLGLAPDGAPDVLAISLSALDAVGHEFGPESPEVRDLLFRLDGWLGMLLDSLDAREGRGNYVVALTADHGITPRPEVSRAHGVAADFIDVDSVLFRAQDTLARRLGTGRWIAWREAGMVGLNRAALAARGVNVDSLAEALARELRAKPGIAEVDTRATLARADTLRNHTALRWRRMLAPGNQAELFITAVPPNYLGHPRDTQHGQASDADAHVTFVIAGPGIRPGRYRQHIGVVDLAPTLARLAGIPPLEHTDGRPLTAALQ